MKAKHKTCKAYNDVGHAHALTFTCFQNRPFLSKDRSRQWLIDAIDAARIKHEFDVWAYVIMPEHVHLLVWPRRPTYDTSKWLSAIKTPVTRKALRFIQLQAPTFLSQMADQQPTGEIHYRFWQRGRGYDRNLTEAKTVFAEIDYFHMNPVRRKLCEKTTDWYWSSAADFADLRQGPLKLNLESLPRTLDSW